MSIQIRVNEFDHIELDNCGDIWEFSLDSAQQLSEDLRSMVRNVRAERRLQQLLEERKELRDDRFNATN